MLYRAMVGAPHRPLLPSLPTGDRGQTLLPVCATITDLEEAGAGAGVRVEGSGFRVQGPGSMSQGPGCRVQGPGSSVQGPGSSVQGPGLCVQRLVFT
jgi:hypothetical protein